MVMHLTSCRRGLWRNVVQIGQRLEAKTLLHRYLKTGCLHFGKIVSIQLHSDNELVWPWLDYARCLRQSICPTKILECRARRVLISAVAAFPMHAVHSSDDPLTPAPRSSQLVPTLVSRWLVRPHRHLQDVPLEILGRASHKGGSWLMPEHGIVQYGQPLFYTAHSIPM